MGGRAVRQFLHRTEGAAAVEFALIAPVVLIILAGLVNVGLQFREQGRLNQATREAAEAAMFTRDVTVLAQVLDKALFDQSIPADSPRAVQLLCLCPGQSQIPNCTPTQAQLCAATGLPWEIVIDISASTQYQPLFGGDPLALQSMMQVHVR